MKKVYSELTTGQNLYFIGQVLPMKLIARSERYGCVVRTIDKNADIGLLQYEIDRGCAIDIDDAWSKNKQYPVYSLLDFLEEKAAPSNLLFPTYDFFKQKDCERAIRDLYRGEHELSRRHGTDLQIDWNLTNSNTNNE